MRSKIIIIIINWNNYEDTKECLISLEKITYPNYKVIVVDNNSTDGSYEKLKSEFSNRCQFIRNNDNLGYAEGNNVGIRMALVEGAEYLWILNNDVIVHPDALPVLMDVISKNDNRGIAGSKVYYYQEKNKIFSAGAKIVKWSGESVSFGKGEIDNGQYDILKEVEYVSGCSMLLSSRMIKDIGMFDKKFFLYYEEADLAARATKKGWKIYYVPNSIVWHKVTSTTKRLNDQIHYYLIRNRIYFIRLYYPKNILTAFIWSLRHDFINHLLKSRWELLKITCMAYFDLLTNHLGKNPQIKDS